MIPAVICTKLLDAQAAEQARPQSDAQKRECSEGQKARSSGQGEGRERRKRGKRSSGRHLRIRSPSSGCRGTPGGCGTSRAG
eukprot:3311996-Rhodomonas_salina.2